MSKTRLERNPINDSKLRINQKSLICNKNSLTYMTLVSPVSFNTDLMCFFLLDNSV